MNKFEMQVVGNEPVITHETTKLPPVFALNKLATLHEVPCQQQMADGKAIVLMVTKTEVE
jgi:hypothetical protein